MEKFNVEKMTKIGVEGICEKLDEYRKRLIEREEFHSEMEKDPNASNVGKHYEIGAANATINARSILEEIFDF